MNKMWRSTVFKIESCCTLLLKKTVSDLLTSLLIKSFFETLRRFKHCATFHFQALWRFEHYDVSSTATFQALRDVSSTARRFMWRDVSSNVTFEKSIILFWMSPFIEKKSYSHIQGCWSKIFKANFFRKLFQNGWACWKMAKYSVIIS